MEKRKTMKKKILYKAAGLLAAICIASTTPLMVLADGNDAGIREEILSSSETPYIAFGQNLNASEKQIVLDKFELTEEELSGYKVSYVTNEMEHKYLDGKVPAEVIGTRAISCVLVKKGNPGQGIRVTTENINYCTVSMYKNALITAGVEDADVYVAGPSMISGTAALIGIWMAYEDMTGETLSEDRKETAIDEIVTIGDIFSGNDVEKAVDNATGDAADADRVEELFDYIKAKVIADGLTDPEKINEIIEEAEAKYRITLTEDQKNSISKLMEGIGGLDIDPATLLSQAGDLYDKYGDSILAGAKELMGKVVTDEVKKSIWSAIGGFFKKLIGKIFG